MFILLRNFYTFSVRRRLILILHGEQINMQYVQVQRMITQKSSFTITRYMTKLRGSWVEGLYLFSQVLSANDLLSLLI